MGFIKNEEAVGDCSYIELSINFGKKVSVEEMISFATMINGLVEQYAGIDYSIDVMRIDLARPGDEQ